MPHPSHRPEAASQPDRARSLLARKWAYRLSQVVVVPLSRDQLDREVAEQLDAVCAVVAGARMPAEQIGERLVALGYVGESGLRCTMDVLGKGLPALPEFQPPGRFAERIVTTLGSLACEFLAASRRNVLEQQENMHRSLLKAVRDAHWHLKLSEARFDEVVTSSASGVMLVGLDGRLVRANASIGDILGYSPAELIGKPVTDLVPEDSARILRDAMRTLLTGRKDRIKQAQRLLRRDGDVARISLTASLLRNADELPGQFVMVIEDGTELMLLQNELSRQALHDVLTGLPNRQFFGTYLEAALLRQDPAHGVTLFQLELDTFDMVCNSLGRRAGERLLVHFAQRLKAVMASEKAMIARFEGAGFGVLVENSATTPGIESVMASINDECADPFYVDGHGLAISASAGVVDRPPGEAEPSELLRAAEESLRRAKSGRRAQWHVFEPGCDVDQRREQALAVSLPGAWENGEVIVCYRPVVRLDGGGGSGVEAVLRWDRPGLASLAHRECVELADQTGLILPLGEWLLRAACGQAEWWRGQSGFGGPLTVGLSAHQVADRNLVRRVTGVLDEIGLDPRRLRLGVPVSALPEASDVLVALRDLGVQTMLDDFTFGPDDLRAVGEFSIGSVRVAGRLLEWQSATLAELVQRAGVSVVVDGVTTASQAAWWRDAGAELATGDHFGAACPPEDVIARLG